MRSEFLIIGFTGPLGSGCSTAADFLANNLKDYQIDSKIELNKTNNLIDQYYRYLKTIQEQTYSLEKDYKKCKNQTNIEPDEYLKFIKEHSMNSNVYSEENRKELNRKLRKIIEKRDLLNLFIKTNIPNFTIISMSDMIVKLVIQKAVDSELKDRQEFIDCEIEEDVKNEIRHKAEKYYFILDKYDEMIENDKLSDNVENQSIYEDIDEAFKEINELKKILSSKKSNYLQDFGDNLRGTGNPFVRREIAKKCPKNLNCKNVRYDYLETVSVEAKNYIKYMERRTDRNKTSYFIIDSFRNPYEVEFFRKRFGSFYLCSVFANKENRKRRLEIDRGFFSNDREERDQGKGNSFNDLNKQDIPSCTLISDYAINNEQDIESFKFKLIRFLMLIDNPGCVIPNTDETFMNIAYTLSLRSTCLSRQVGAIVTNSNGYIIGAGWNDVGTGQLGCSTRCRDDYHVYTDEEYILDLWKGQFRDFEKKGLLNEYDDKDYICFKDIKSKEAISDKVDKILENYFKTNLDLEENQKNKIYEFSETLKEKLNIKRLEYARSLHAEENAILQVAINGGVGISGGTIYTTTFPCELCAKKIYQSGIKRIVYIEPYPESISESIFLKDGVRHIDIDQFEGVKANSYYKLFKSQLDRKDLQKIDKINPHKE